MGWRGCQHPKGREGRADTQYCGPMPSTMPACRRQAVSKLGSDVFNLPSHSQHPTWLPKGKTKALDAVSLSFCWEPYWTMGGGCGFSWPVSQTHYPGHSHLCPHRSLFLHSDAWLHGWGIIFTTDSGILHPLKGMSCLNFVAVKPCLGWM